MKRFLLLFLVLPSLATAQFQLTNDHRILIEECIDLPDLQPYFDADNIGTNNPLVIMLNEHVVEAFGLMKYGENVRFETMEEIFTENRTAFIKFTQMDIDASSAEVRLSYAAKVRVEVFFERTMDGWEVKRTRFLNQ